MSVILASTAGFCYGVRRAVKLALSAAQRGGAPLYTIGPLIHNQQAIDLLKSKGITIVQRPDDVIGGSRILIRAHGITPEVQRALMSKCAELCDATCPHVTNAQRIVEKHAGEGYVCLIIGDRGHAEVDGLMGYSAGRGFVVEKDEDIFSLPPLEKVCVVSQTTRDEENFDRLVGLIKERFKDVKVFKTICNATSLRQRELLEIARKSDIVIVVGGKESANTRRLVEISERTGTCTIHVETADEINLNDIEPRDVVGITAGASTPHWVIRNVVETVQNHQLRKQRFLIVRFFVQFMQFLIYSSILLAMGAAMLTYSSVRLMGQVIHFPEVFLAFLFVLSMHLVNKRLSLPRDERLLYGSLKSFARYKNAFTLLSIFCIVASFITAFFMGELVFALIVLSCALGLVYSLTLLPESWGRIIRHRRLMDIPASKDIFMTAGWGFVVVLIPHLTSQVKNPAGFYFTLPMVMLLVLVRSILLDVRDLEGDIALGKETIPILLGPRGRRYLIRAMFLLVFLIPLAGWLTKALPVDALAMTLLLPYLLLHYPLSQRQEYYQSLLYDGFLEGQFMLAGLITYGANILIHS